MEQQQPLLAPQARNQQQVLPTTIYTQPQYQPQPQQQYVQAQPIHQQPAMRSNCANGAMMHYTPPEKAGFSTGLCDCCANPGGLLLCCQVWLLPCHASGRSWQWLNLPGGYIMGLVAWLLFWIAWVVFMSISFTKTYYGSDHVNFGFYSGSVNWTFFSVSWTCFWLTFLLVLVFAFKTFEKMHDGKSLGTCSTCCKAFWCQQCFLCQIRREQLMAQRSKFVNNLYPPAVQPSKGQTSFIVPPQNNNVAANAAMVRQEAPHYTAISGQPIQHPQHSVVSAHTMSHPGYAGSDPGAPVFASSTGENSSILKHESASNEILPDRGVVMLSSQPNLPTISGTGVSLAEKQSTVIFESTIVEPEKEEHVQGPTVSKMRMETPEDEAERLKNEV